MLDNSIVLLCTTFLLSKCTAVPANDIRGVEKRHTDDSTGSYYNSIHNFIWRRTGSFGGISFEEQLLRSAPDPDFVYLFTGDTQHWYPCTGDNTPCHVATDNCGFNQRGIDCDRRQSEYANRMQQISMAALNRRLYNVTGRKMITGLVINGDLTNFGHKDELNRLNQLWTATPFDGGIPVYPGLGNHDYSNNAGQCTLDRCVNRMLRWFRSYVKDTLKLRLDLRTSSKYLVGEENIGSFAYSWDECPRGSATDASISTCFHFVQLNNYPTYAKHISQLMFEWKILPSLNWLVSDLRREGAGKSIIINFHDVDTAFSYADKLRFHSVLESSLQNLTNTRILAILFAHIHHQVGLKETWCIGGRSVPLIYSGSVPANNYILAQFSPISRTIKAVYAINVESEAVSYVNVEHIPETYESC